MKRIDKFIDKYGPSFDPLIFSFDGESYITHRNSDGTTSYRELKPQGENHVERTSNYSLNRLG